MVQPKRNPPADATASGTVPGEGGALFEEFIGPKIITMATLLRRASALRFQRMFGLPLVEWRVLIRIGTSEPLSLNEVANHVGLAKSQVSRVVSKLVDRGLVSRKPNPERSREVELTLTPAGWEIHRGIIDAGLVRNSELIEDIDPEALAQVHAVIDIFTERAREFLQTEQALVSDTTPASDADLLADH